MSTAEARTGISGLALFISWLRAWLDKAASKERVWAQILIIGSWLEIATDPYGHETGASLQFLANKKQPSQASQLGLAPWFSCETTLAWQWQAKTK